MYVFEGWYKDVTSHYSVWSLIGLTFVIAKSLHNSKENAMHEQDKSVENQWYLFQKFHITYLNPIKGNIEDA